MISSAKCYPADRPDIGFSSDSGASNSGLLHGVEKEYLPWPQGHYRHNFGKRRTRDESSLIFARELTHTARAAKWCALFAKV